jgi:hypothetical protein
LVNGILGGTLCSAIFVPGTFEFTFDFVGVDFGFSTPIACFVEVVGVIRTGRILKIKCHDITFLIFASLILEEFVGEFDVSLV